MSSEAEEKKDGEEPKSSKMKLIIILVVALAVLGGGGAFAYFKFFASHSDPASHAEAESHAKETEPIIKEMDTFIVNLADTGGKRFLKLTMKAKLNNANCLAEFGTRAFELRDLILMVLASKEVEDITRTEDKTSLKREITTSLNRVLKKGQVQEIYFTEFLIQ